MSQITTKEASQILGISKRTLFRWEKEGRIKSTLESILNVNVRVYDRDFIVKIRDYDLMVKKILGLNKQIEEHNSKLPEFLEQSRKHQLIQTYKPGKPLKLLSSSEVEAAIKAFNNEEKWSVEHKRLITEFGQLLQSFRTSFPDKSVKELFLKEEQSK